MFLQTLSLQGFRNLPPQHLSFHPQTNFIFGANAQGKTNLLESIYFVCLTKSFRTHEERDCLTKNHDQFILQAVFEDERRVEQQLQIQYIRDSGKKILLNNKPVYSTSTLIGQFPVVKLSREDQEITAGSPQHRRRFCNILLSQVAAAYLQTLKEYERVLLQRNRILQNFFRGRGEDQSACDLWTEQLVHKAQKLFEMRRQLVEDLNPLLAECYRRFNKGEPLQICYQPNVGETAGQSFATVFWQRLRACRQQEQKQGTTLLGPHRDEFVFFIAKKELRKFGSRGEHKSALISLKAAEVALIRNRLDTWPIILLDDLYAELDLERAQGALNHYPKELQRFVTGTSFDYPLLQPLLDQDNWVWWMKEGRADRAKTL